MPTGTDSLSSMDSGGRRVKSVEPIARLLRTRGAQVPIAVRRSRQGGPVAQAMGSDGLLVGSVSPQDGDAAAGFANGATDALGPIDGLMCAAGAFEGSKRTCE